MRPLVTIACLSTLALALVGCGSSSSGTSPRLRVVHASPNAPQVDVLIDDVRELSSVPYKASSPYLGVCRDTQCQGQCRRNLHDGDQCQSHTVE